jgi:hypothetical protein
LAGDSISIVDELWSTYRMHRLGVLNKTEDEWLDIMI